MTNKVLGGLFMKIHEIVFGSTEVRAKAKFNEIINEIIASEDEFIEKETRDVVITNKRKITAVTANESQKGRRCHKAYVDWYVKIIHLEKVIKPCLLPNGYKDGQFNIEYFGDMKWN